MTVLRRICSPPFRNRPHHTRLALALLVVGLVIGGTDGNLQVSQGVSSGDNGNVRESVSASRLHLQGTVAVAHGPMRVGGRTTASSAGLDVLTPSPVLPPQGHPPVAAAEESGATSSSNRRDDAAIQLGITGLVGTTDEQFDLGAGHGGRIEPSAIEAIICSYPWDCDTALRIVQCESGWNPAAISWDGTSYGLFQIWRGHAWRWSDFWESWQDPVRNTEYAYELWLESGWGIWDCR